jgi:8-hydroxy-5-deazaflavin:NADPH oxidoreductase
MSEEKKMNIGVLGGTGPEGSGLALRLAQAGFPVLLGSRSTERARDKAQELTEKLEKAGHSASFTSSDNRGVASASELLFLTAPFEHAADLLRDCQAAFREDAVLVDVTVPLVFQAGRVGLRELTERSGSEHLSKFLPGGVKIVAAFKTIPARLLGDLDASLDCDMFICGDSEEAKIRVLEIARRFPGLRPLDVGSLQEAGTLERMSALAIGMNKRYKAKYARFRVVGV